MRRRSRRRTGARRELRAALIGIAAFVLVCVLVFSGGRPGGSGFRLNARVANATQLRPHNPVRIAGVTVGEVTGVRPAPAGTSVVEMRLGDQALPLHADATLHIAPRLALEGNFAVAVSPGTPSAPSLASGATIPLAHTSGSVQLDQVVDIFDSATRSGAQAGIGALSRGLGGRGRGPTGASDLRSSFDELDGAIGDLQTLARSLRGRSAGDLPHAVRGSGAVTELLSRDRRALADISANTSTVGAALVASDGALSQSVGDLDPVLRRAPATLAALDRALPRLNTFAKELEPGLVRAAVDLPPADRFVRQLGSLASPPELPRAVAALRPLVGDLPELERVLTGTFPFAEQVGACVDKKIVPALELTVPDGKLSTGRPAYQDLVHAFTRLSAANPSFDANGRILRAVAAGGEKTLTALVPPFGQAVAGIAPDIQGVAPVWLGPGVTPPWEPGADCRKQPLPDLTQRKNVGLLGGITELPSAPALASARRHPSLPAALALLRRSLRKARP